MTFDGLEPDRESLVHWMVSYVEIHSDHMPEIETMGKGLAQALGTMEATQAGFDKHIKQHGELWDLWASDAHVESLTQMIGALGTHAIASLLAAAVLAALREQFEAGEITLEGG